MSSRWASSWAGCAAGLLFLAACAGPTDGRSSQVEVLILAASSLTDAFAELESAFEDMTPGVDAVISLGGSSTLREQILSGAPADLFASADPSNMNVIAQAGLLRERSVVFARNRLRIAVPPGNPALITGLRDFANEELLIGLCAAGVPCGDLGRQALQMAGVVPAIDTNEPNVRALLTKIEEGDLDVGIVYVTDVASASGGVEGIGFSESEEVAAEYPIAILSDPPNPSGAAAFVEFVLSGEGQEILHRYGFESP